VLSERLVLLAENLVAKAVQLVYAELVGQFGRLVDEEGRPVLHAVFGLGKLGGVALGYASDIELLCRGTWAGIVRGRARTYKGAGKWDVSEMTISTHTMVHT
jgi:glutamine synthetase adenylyltransferase